MVVGGKYFVYYLFFFVVFSLIIKMNMEDLLHEWNLQQYLDVFKGKKILFAVYTHGKPTAN